MIDACINPQKASRETETLFAEETLFAMINLKFFGRKLLFGFLCRSPEVLFYLFLRAFSLPTKVIPWTIALLPLRTTVRIVFF